MAERVEFHGGPKHGKTADIPFDTSTSMEVEALFDVNGQRLRRRGVYTRVHDIQGRPTKDFEFAGYITTYLPLET